MAIQSKTLNAAEHDWFATRSGLPTYAALNDHKIQYFCTKGIKSNASISIPISQMERVWVQSVGSSTSNNPYERWRAACAARSVAVGKSVDECKFNFYTSVASGTNP
jgi:hypothetical protein